MVRLQSSSFKFESMSKPLLVIWKSLLKATPEYIHRFWFTFDWKINGRALGAALWHSLDKSGWQEQTQSVSQVCQVGGSCCWQQQALFKMRKTCYHSCNNWPVLESNLFWWPGFVNFWQWLLLFFFFSFEISAEIFDGVCINFARTCYCQWPKQQSLLNLSIIHWSLSTNRT